MPLPRSTGSLAKHLGNTPRTDGAGQKHRERGLIQFSGRTNHVEYREARASNTGCGFLRQAA